MKQFLVAFMTILLTAFSCAPAIEQENPTDDNQNLVPVESVVLSTYSLSLEPGEKITLTATVSPENATDKSLTWTSSDKEVATVSQTGEVTAVAEGQCTISVSCDKRTAVCEVTVAINTTHVASISLSSEAVEMFVGETRQLTATVLPEDATDKTLVWTSSDESIATVSQKGELTAVAEGHCTVSASCDGKKADCEVSVAIKTIPVTSVYLGRISLELLVGETHQLTAGVKPDDATDKTVTWSSSDESVATVDNGLVTAISIGEATITATAGECSATCSVKVNDPFSYGGMCMESISGGSIIIENWNNLTIEYKLENQKWVSTDNQYIRIATQAGERVWFRGHNESYAKKIIKSEDEYYYETTTFQSQGGDFYLYGNLMSLVYGDDYENETGFSGDYNFYRLFNGNGNIINHPEYDIELPATKLAPYCYRNMFYNCSKLTRAPKLPASKLVDGCYAAMFEYCYSMKTMPEMAAEEMAYLCCTWMMEGTAIEEVPELPAMNLASSCYQYMFMDCKNLKKGPSILPATELAHHCYSGMFLNCENLEEAPILPATKMASSCYASMFGGCKSLTVAPALPSTELATSCYQQMFEDCGLKEMPDLPADTLEAMCYYKMFMNCTNLTRAVLPAHNLDSWCYYNMFSGCSNLSYINMQGTKIKSRTIGENYKLVNLTDGQAGSCCLSWVEGVAATGTFVKNPEATWDVRGINGIPEGWEVQYSE